MATTERAKVKASDPPAVPTLPEGVVWKGNPQLIPFLVPVDTLHEDPANANTHPERSISSIAGSYARFGQQKPLVFAADRTVRDGNGQLRAAAERLKWTHVAAVPTDLANADLMAYAIAANRTAEHSERDTDVIARMFASLRDEGYDVAATGYSETEVDSLLASAAPANVDPPVDFPSYDESIETDYECPKCGYQWSGKTAVSRPDDG